jgi:hypothetical protein
VIKRHIFLVLQIAARKSTYVSSTNSLVLFRFCRPIRYKLPVLRSIQKMYDTSQDQYTSTTTQLAFPNECVSAGATITLNKDISALEIVRRDNASGHFGVMAQLSKGCTVEICGPGFNERTCRASCHDRLFFIFRQDLGL